ncbi:4Fe-4S dicluster domain-containing protein [bacterium]|nr:4Fe-4S dicluster domain-containing protein [bacterium]
MSLSEVKKYEREAGKGLAEQGERNMSDLVQIRTRADEQKEEKKDGLSRRNFLKILGAAPVVTAAGCSDSSKHKAYPNVFGQEDSIPGVAVWYNSTCTECSAGCGISVRTREGRAVKVEGNRSHPLSKGGLCGLGQASLQALYDPDRVRQPLVKKVDGGTEQFVPISWGSALKKLTAALKFAGSDFALVTGEQSGSYKSLASDFVAASGGQRVVYDPLSPVEVAEASRVVYGEYGIPTYRLERSDFVLNFGADFLETWASPVEYARRWADGRRNGGSTRYVHIEPRLSLTGSNADRWLKCAPGSEIEVAKFLLKSLIDAGKGSNLSGRVLSGIQSVIGNTSAEAAAEASGLEQTDILLVADRLKHSKHGVVLSGGATSRTSYGEDLAVICSLMNLVLASVGDVVQLGAMRTPESDRKKLADAIDALGKGNLRLLLVGDGVNPAFTLPADYGLQYAINQGRVERQKAINEAGNVDSDIPLVVSFSSSLDETAKMADLILPSHHSLEDWGDTEAVPGIRSIVQPVMTPVFDTKSFGDTLLTVAKALGVKISSAGDTSTFQDYVKAQWRKVYNGSGSTKGFAKWWLERVEQGGVFDDTQLNKRVKVNVSPEAFRSAGDKHAVSPAKGELTLLPYFSVKTFDGRAANRPWLQELPDPVVQAVWDSWGELHENTAAQLGVKTGDSITVRNAYGELNLPVYISDRIAEGTVGVPVGQGHTEYGRYAREVSHVGNVFDLLSRDESENKGLSLVSASVAVTRSLKKSPLVVSQGSDSQAGRGLARTSIVEASKSSHEHDSHHGSSDEHGHHDEEHGHHEPKQMYEQRVHPMYEWVMAVDLAACTGCSACVTACYAENNIPTVGKKVFYQGREMSWLRLDRYFDERPESGGHSASYGDHHASAEEFTVSFMPMMCQQCNNAPCEPVCPVYATYHNDEGLNVMVYNRCVGTRYCSNNCSYKARRFNWFEFEWPEPMNLQVNPDVTKRAAGVMEKCTFCVQRIKEAQGKAKDLGRTVLDGEVQPACVQSCPTQALAFGNINDSNSKVSKLSKDSRAYKVLDHHLNTQPGVIYLENVKYKV